MAQLALEHLQDYKTASLTRMRVIPQSVVEFLAEEGHAVDRDAVQGIDESLANIWI